jgi:uncharacterized phage protein (TIGR02218 family)
VSKTISAGHTTMIATGAIKLAWCVKFIRKDAQEFRFAAGSRTITLDSEVYDGAPGFMVSSLTCSAGFSVDTAELTMLTDSDLVKADFYAGRWDGCRVEFNQYNWSAAADGFIPWPFYRVSNITPIIGGFVLELRDGRQLWQQDFTRATGKTCPYRLGDAKCTKVLTSFTHTFEITSVANRAQFTDSALAQDADYFTEGEVIFDDGLHEGLSLLVKEHETGGVIKLAVPLLADMVVGQTGVIIAGCLKRRDEDCKTKFNNVINFGGAGVDAPTVEELVGQ